MRKPVFFGLLVAIGISMTMAACKHEPPVNPNPVNPVNPVDTGICFERDILPIFVSSCAKGGCHDANTMQDGFKFTDYASIVAKDFAPGNPGDTKLYERIMETDADKRMPPLPNPALTADQKEKIRRWIAEGAKNTTGCVVNCDSNNYKYGSAIKPMLDTYCNGCHNSQQPSGGYVLDMYSSVKTLALNGRLLGAIRHDVGFSPMPKGGAKLSDCQVRQVQKWIADGALNN